MKQEVEEVFDLGYKVFKTKENLEAWLCASNRTFGNLRPMDLLQSPEGISMVKNELTKMVESQVHV